MYYTDDSTKGALRSLLHRPLKLLLLLLLCYVQDERERMGQRLSKDQFLAFLFDALIPLQFTGRPKGRSHHCRQQAYRLHGIGRQHTRGLLSSAIASANNPQNQIIEQEGVLSYIRRGLIICSLIIDLGSTFIEKTLKSS